LDLEDDGMSLPLLTVLFLGILYVAYHGYGTWVSKQVDLDDTRSTPAHDFQDGVDFVPTKPFYLFSQHFSAIAAAGPIAGPILACQAFGWGPCLLWILLGVVLIGAVHDFMSLTASVRHRGHSVAEITREHLGGAAGKVMMAFIWLALMYVIVAFTDIISASFVSKSTVEGMQVSFNAGGAVAAASVFYLLLSMLLGVVKRFWNPPLWLMTIIFVPAILGAAWLGTLVSPWFVLNVSQPNKVWALMILIYCALASLLPVWALLQPRGYLGGFVLYLVLLVGVIGIFFGDFEIKQEAFKTWNADGMTGSLFPFLFVTIACGACSGFHGLVCSGTTSKQVDRESHMHAVGYGAMLAEGFVAFVALITIMIVADHDLIGLKPATIYGNSIGQFLTLLIGEKNLPFALTFGAMAFSCFVFDTLDVSTRLSRYFIQEFFGWKNKTSAVVATLLTLILPVYFIYAAPEGSWLKFWILFGASNQLLAALTLLSITLWLYRARKRIAFTLLPMLFVLIITLWALVKLMFGHFYAAKGLDIAMVNAGSAAILILLSLYLVITALRKSSRSPLG
jgi:carbon starvation protein